MKRLPRDLSRNTKLEELRQHKDPAEDVSLMSLNCDLNLCEDYEKLSFTQEKAEQLFKRIMRHFPSLSIVLFTLIVAGTAQGQTSHPRSGKQTKPSTQTNSQQEDENAILPPPTTKKDLYPADVDANKEIDEAVKQAADDHKRVLLIFGGNWCYDCHVLDQALHQGRAGKIVEESYELVHIDVGEFNKNLEIVKKYNVPLDKGVPAVSVLDSKGNLLYSAEGEFESARQMVKKQLVEFLLKWKEDRPPSAKKN